MSGTTVPAQESRQQLHNIVREEIPFHEKVREALEVGTEHLEATRGCLIQVDQETTLWEVVVATDGVGGLGPAGSEQHSAETFCREVIEEQPTLVLHDGPADELRTEPIFEHSDGHWYLGVPIVLDDGLYGAVCFVGDGAQPERPPETDLLFADHLTRLLERELARDKVASELSNQSNLATVLNRVLRHNLRNDMSVIRGYTEVIAEQVDDGSIVETIFTHIDDLMQLSDRARELEEILSASSERQNTEVTALTKRIAENVSSDYPDASIAVNSDEDVHTSVLPTFSRALEELLTNAVKHTGRGPTVTVTVESVPNAVEIRIEDSGSGLPEQERQVIESGAEAPLTHGSGLGLWLAHWVITSHDGSIDATVTDNGTKMTVSIPRKPTVGVQQQLMDLTRSRDKYKAAFEEANDVMAIVDDDGRVLEANEGTGDICDLDSQAVIGRSLTEFFPDDFDFEAEWQRFQTEGFDRATTTIRSAEGTERVLEYSGTANIVPGQHLVVCRDITERKEREREVEALKERYETFLNAAPDPIFVAETDSGELIEVNEAAETLIGEPRENIVGRDQQSLHPPEKAELYCETLESLQSKRATIRRLPDGSRPKLLIADGEAIPIEISMDTVELPDTEVMFGIFRDVSEQIEREQQLELAETVFQNTQDALFVVDVVEDGEFHIQRVNTVYEELTGRSNEQLTGKTPRGVVGDELGRDIERHYRTCLERQETIQYDETIPVGGEQREWETKVTPIVENGNVDKLVGAMRDVTTEETV